MLAGSDLVISVRQCSACLSSALPWRLPGGRLCQLEQTCLMMGSRQPASALSH